MTAAPELDLFVSTANDLARRAGRLALERLGKVHSSRKGDDSIVTEADLAAQNLIVDALAAKFPTHAVLAEEDRTDQHRLPAPDQAEFCWVIDPIDGTRNYSRGYPCFCTSLALLQKGAPIVGAVYDPLLDRLYRGRAAAGAYLGETPLRSRNNSLQSDTLIGLPSGHGSKMPWEVHLWIDRMNLRSSGSAALHLAYVAAGWLDAAYAYQCKIWDIAAGWVLLREAGAQITDLAGAELFPADPAALAGKDLPFLAAGSTLHAQLLKTLR